MPFQVAFALRMIPVAVPVHVVELRLAEHVYPRGEAVGLPVRGVDRHPHAGLAQHGAAAGPVLLLQLEEESHLVLAAQRSDPDGTGSTSR